MKRYLKLWYLLSIFSTQIGLESRFGAVFFLIGKFLRFIVFFFFIFILASTVKYIAGYTLWQMILIFATFNLIDVSSQFFFREVYKFRGYVVQGTLDYFLIKPVIPLFRFLFGGADALDLPILITSIVLVFISLIKVGDVTWVGIVLYIALILNALTISLSFHIFILALGILTTNVDNLLWLYRDLIEMGKIPVTLYKYPLRGIITFVIPVGIMITFPAQAAFGDLFPELVLLSFLMGFIFILLSGVFWRFSIKRYSSASS